MKIYKKFGIQVMMKRKVNEEKGHEINFTLNNGWR